jgi:hypothetical protein
MMVMRQVLSFALAVAFPFAATAEVLKKEPAVASMPTGSIVYVDDGTCPAAQIKKVVIGSSAPNIPRVRSCISLDTMRTEDAAAAAAAAVAVVYKWMASVGLEKGDANICGTQDPRSIEIKDGVFRGVNGGGTWTLPLRRLNSDGSGRIVAHEFKTNAENLFDFVAGSGPRMIRQTDHQGACVWTWTPMSAEAAAQSNGPFDGKWLAQTNRCFPAGSGYRVGVDLQVRASKFTLASTAADGTVKICVINIQPDGTFTNQICDLAVSGRIKGDTMELHNTIPGGSGFCDKAYKRDLK